MASTHALIAWTWDPGAGRSAPSITDAQFIERPEAWAEVGMLCPRRLNKHRQVGATVLAWNDEVLHHNIGFSKVGATADIDAVACRFDRKVTGLCHS